MNEKFRHDLLFRLRWKITADLDSIEIMSGPPDQANYVPLFGHPYSDESLADVPISRLEVYIKDIETCPGWDAILYDESMKHYGYQPPAHLFINNEDGHTITLGQFVTEFQAYMGKHMDQIKESKGALYENVGTHEGRSEVRVMTDGGRSSLPDNTDLYVETIWADGEDGQFLVEVSIYAEGELGFSLEKFWTTQKAYLAKYEQGRKA